MTVTGRNLPANAGITGFGDAPLAGTPIQAAVIRSSDLREGGGTGLSALTRVDASIGDAYNAQGYWTSFNIRGLAIDNRYNFFRDGLPINAETSLPLDNKSAVEVLKGTSGIQAGTSAPGGLVNLVVKRPEGRIRSGGFDWREDGTLGAWADLSQRFGAQQSFGLRLNIAAEHLNPITRDDHGERSLVALAGDWRPSANRQLALELETSRQAQPSVPGFSLLGSNLPAARSIDPRINLNNQPWTLPVVLEGSTGSVRWSQGLAADWTLVAHAMRQSLHSDDRLAYSFGCSKEGNYDRYCSDGSFDEYAYQSDGERRISSALDLHVQGGLQSGPVSHKIVFGAIGTRFRLRTQPQVDDSQIVGSATIDGQTVIAALPPDLGLISNTERTERSSELYVRDQLTLGPGLGLWLGLRHTRLERSSVQTDGSQATDYSQAFTTPWLALSQTLGGGHLVYASWGEGTESTVAPNRPGYTNPGQPLPAINSRQFELGLKRDGPGTRWGLAWFDIRRPQFDDVSHGCDSQGTPCITTQLDGQLGNQGLEANAASALGPFSAQLSATWLRMRIQGSSDPALDGKRPTNVPNRSLRATAAYALSSLPGLRIQAGLSYEGPRMVLPDNSLRIPGWTRSDLAASYQTQWGHTTLTALVGVDNLADRRAWRESPYQYQHVYLFPVQPRTWRASLQVDL